MVLINESQVDMPPSYGSQEYWNKRFQSEPEPFEWLEAPDVLDPYLRDALQCSDEQNLGVLHIGCGTSDLSYHLLNIVKKPGRIHNLDYSDIAIDLGRKRELELCREKGFVNSGSDSESSAASRSMRWDAVDLLDHKSFLSACKPGAYSVIVDKSTSDCIACCDDVKVRLPYAIDTWSASPTTMELGHPLHPLHVLAVHMAVASRPGCRWIALSYSSDRFPFVDGLFSSRPHLPGFPDTGKLWKLLDKREVQDRDRDSAELVDGERVVHRPKSSHWLYVMERTKVPLFIRGSHI